MSAINQRASVAFFEETPDRIVVFLRHRVITSSFVRRLAPVLFAVPVHPVTKTNRLLGLNTGEFIHALFAKRDEPIDASEAIARN